MSIAKLDTAIYRLLVLYAFASVISIAASNIAISCALLLAIVRYIKQPFKFRVDKRLIQVILFFWAAILVSAIAAYEHEIAFSKLWAYIYRTLPLFMVAGFIDDKKKLYNIIAALGLSVGIAGLYAIWQNLHEGIRAEGFSHYMALSGCLVQTLPVLAVLAIERQDMGCRRRALFGITGVIAALALICTLTRGAWLGALVAALLYVALRRPFSKKNAAALCLAAAVAIGGLSFSSTLQHRFFSIADVSITGENAQRLILWHDAWNMFVDHPVVGVGPGNFKQIRLTRYFSPQATEELGHAHNNFLHILAENGIIGFAGFAVLYGYILAFLFRRGIGRGQALAMAVFLSTAAFLTQGLTEFNYGDSAVIRQYWFILALSAVDSVEGENPSVQKDTA